MKRKTKLGIALVTVVTLLETWALYTLRPSGERWRSAAIVKDEPTAHALYDRMIEAMQEANTLSYTCQYSRPERRAQHYNIRLKKPNQCRVEAINAHGKLRGTLVGDGNDFWAFWPGVCPELDPEDTNVPREKWTKLYMTNTMVQGHSIAHQLRPIGGHMPFINPSSFYGYSDALQPFIDGVAYRGTHTLRGEPCDIIEVSIMSAKRTWFIWLSQKDHLPRRIKQIFRFIINIVGVEEWLDVQVNSPMESSQFAWSPPDDWQRWIRPKPEDKLLKPGETAPAFTLRSLHGGTISLSDYRDQIVWLYVWTGG